MRNRYDISAMAFTPDGELIAAFSNSGLAQCWDISTGKEVLQLRPPHYDQLEACAFLPDGHLCAGVFREPMKGKSTRGLERGVWFIEHSKYMHTDYGTYILEWDSLGTLCEPQRTTGVERSGSWIRHGNEDVLYLPADYHGRCMATHKDTMILGHESEAVHFYSARQSP